MTDTPTMEQPELLPATPPTFKTLHIQPSEVAPDDLLDGPEPTKQLIDSIRQYGVVDPIVVRAIEGMDFAYIVISGSRRVKAVRHLLAEYASTEDSGVKVPAHLRRIPARLMENAGDAPSDVLTVQANTLRSRNKAAEYKAVKRLMDAGADQKAISRATGLTHAQIKELLRLDSLNEALMDAMAEGKISGTQAHDIARLPAASQERLVETFESNGKLTAMDVHVERQARQETAAQTMDWGAIDAVPVTVEAEEPSPEDVVALAVEALVAAISATESDAYEVTLDFDGRRYTVAVTVTPANV